MLSFLHSRQEQLADKYRLQQFVLIVEYKTPTIRKQAYSNIHKILPPRNEKKKKKKSDKNSDIFHISAQNIDCGYSSEPPRRGGSNKCPQSMFWSRNKKNNIYPCKPQVYYIKVEFKGGQNYIGVFSRWFKPFSSYDQTNCFANSVDPYEDLHCLPFCFWFFNCCPFLEQWVWPDSKMEYSTSETRGWKN